MLKLALGLILNPAGVIEQIQGRRLIKTDISFFILTSLMFALSTMVYSHRDVSLVRFGCTTIFTLLILLPVITFLWSLLQKYACWFFGVKVSLKTIIPIAALGSFYYALIFALSLMVYTFHSPMIMELCLFSLNLLAFALSVRLMQTTYRLLGRVSGKRALITALSPALVIILLGMLIEFLTMLAMYNSPIRR